MWQHRNCSRPKQRISYHIPQWFHQLYWHTKAWRYFFARLSHLSKLNNEVVLQNIKVLSLRSTFCLLHNCVSEILIFQLIKAKHCSIDCRVVLSLVERLAKYWNLHSTIVLFYNDTTENRCPRSSFSLFLCPIVAEDFFTLCRFVPILKEIQAYYLNLLTYTDWWKYQEWNSGVTFMYLVPFFVCVL